MLKQDEGYKITENTSRFAFFKLLCLNLQYIYEFQEKFVKLYNNISVEQFSKFFNEKYKLKLDFLIKEKNKNLFEHLNILNAYAKINPDPFYNFYCSKFQDNRLRGANEFDVCYAKRFLGENLRLKESFGIINERPILGSKDKTKAFAFGFPQEYKNLCLNEVAVVSSIMERNSMDGTIFYNLADGTYRISFLNFFIMQSLALQIFGMENNDFPGSDILQLFSEEIGASYLEEVKKQETKIFLPAEAAIATYNNEIYDWAMETGREILAGKTYKYKEVPALAFLDKAKNFKFSYKNDKKNVMQSDMTTLVSGEFYKEKAPLRITINREGQVNSFTYYIEKIAFEDVLRVKICTERTGTFLRALAEREGKNLYTQKFDGRGSQNKAMSTRERLTYLLPMLAAQLQNEASQLNYCKAYALLVEELEFFRNSTALFNCFMEKNKTSLLINTI